MKNLKKILLVLRAGFLETISDKKAILLLIIIGYILDNGVRCLVENAMYVKQPLGIFEGFIMCINHWYYVIIFLAGYVLMLAGIPRLDSDWLLLVYRTGRKNWLIGEILQIALSSFIYILLLLAGCMAGVSKYAYPGNIWSHFMVYYRERYEEIVLSGRNRFIDQQVFRYYLPYQSVVHGIILLVLCMILMGTIVILFAIIGHKLAGIILNMVFITSVMIFANYHVKVMWLFPTCHSVLMLHNVEVYRQQSFPVYYSYIYLIAAEILVVWLALGRLKNKMF